MGQDIFGQTTTLIGAAARRHWDGVLKGFMAHAASTPGDLAAVIASAPEFAQAHALKGLFCLLLGRREMVSVAREALADAQAALREGQANARESAYVAALGGWLDGSPSGAIAQLEAVLRDYPDDTLAMKLSHAIRFVLGDAAGMRRSIERVLLAYDPAHPGRGYLLGCHAFALEETGAYEQADVTGRQALWMAPDDAWGLHAVAHVHDMTGNARRGLDWFEGREQAWAHCNNFRYHVWWHKALMHLDLGQVDAVLDLYDTEIRADWTDDYRDISNATSLLMRLELDGIDVGPRWAELASICAARTEDGCLIFADLHYLMALTHGEGTADAARLLNRIRRDAADPCNEASARMASPGQAAAVGLCEFTEGRYDSAFRHLSHARSTLQLAGGSHAQRDVFERLTIDAGLRAGLCDEAAAILDERRARRAGRDDGYGEVRRHLIARARGLGRGAHSVSAQ